MVLLEGRGRARIVNEREVHRRDLQTDRPARVLKYLRRASIIVSQKDSCDHRYLQHGIP